MPLLGMATTRSTLESGKKYRRKRYGLVPSKKEKEYEIVGGGNPQPPLDNDFAGEKQSLVVYKKARDAAIPGRENK
jgi:hypothetical protein